MQTRNAQSGIMLVVLIAIGLIILFLFATNLTRSYVNLSIEVSECEQNAGICKTGECTQRELPFSCGETSTTCCLKASEQEADYTRKAVD